MLNQHLYIETADTSDLTTLRHIRDNESRQVFCKLMEILTQTKTMQDKLASVILKFDQISDKTPNQQEIFYGNVKSLKKKLNNQENLLKEKLHLHITTYLTRDLKTEEMDATSSVTPPPKSPASLTKAQKNACNRIRKIKDKLKGTNLEALNVMEKIQKAHTTRNSNW